LGAKLHFFFEMPTGNRENIAAVLQNDLNTQLYTPNLLFKDKNLQKFGKNAKNVIWKHRRIIDFCKVFEDFCPKKA